MLAAAVVAVVVQSSVKAVLFILTGVLLTDLGLMARAATERLAVKALMVGS